MDQVLTVDVGDGHLEVEVTGRGEPVLVIQTALARHELRPLSDAIARAGHFQVLHCHRRGYGGSSPGRGQASITAEAADAGALLRALDAEPAHVVGVSYSAAVALDLASQRPGSVHTLSVVEPPPNGTPGAEGFRQANRAQAESYEAHGSEAALEEFRTMLYGANWREESERDLPGSVAAMERDAPTFFTRDVPALLAWDLGEVEVARIRCPLLYVGGSASGPWFAEMRHRLVSLLPQADQAMIEGAGHLVSVTHPREVAEHIVRLCRLHPLREVG